MASKGVPGTGAGEGGSAKEPARAGGELAGGPGAVLQTGGRLVVFARGADNAIWHAWQDRPDDIWS